MRLQCLESAVAQNTADAVDLRRRVDERALDKEEEDYFNEDRFCVSGDYFIFIVLLELSSHILAFTAMKKILHLLLIQKRKNLLLIQRKKNRSLTYQMELLQALLLRGIVVFHNENS